MSPIDDLWTRRRFLALLGAGATLGPVGSLAGESRLPRLPERPLGRTGVSLPVLGAGLAFDTGPSQIVLRQAVRMGVRCMDNADAYTAAADGIRRYFQRFPEDRSRVFLILKPLEFDFNVSTLDRALDAMLVRNGTTYADLFMLSNVIDPDVVRGRAIRSWAEKAKKSGRIRLFGFSTHNAKGCLGPAAEAGFHDVVMFPYNYRLMDDRELSDGISACHEGGVGLVTMKFRGFGPGVEEEQAQKRLTAASVEGHSPNQIKLKAVLEDPRITCVVATMRDVDTLRRFVSVAAESSPLDGAERRELHRFAEATRDTYCEGCSERCEPLAGVPVADVLRFLMYDRAYGEKARAQACFRGLAPDIRERIARLDFCKAEECCPRSLPITRLLRLAARNLG